MIVSVVKREIMQTKTGRFYAQGLPLPDPNSLQESVRNQFDAMVFEQDDILRWEDDGGQIILPLDSPPQRIS
jgi:hypothetical protein